MRYIKNYLTKIATEKNKSFELMLIDLDNFKNINDSLGHETGDALLIEITKRLKNLVSEKGVLARQGGDEFILIVHNGHHAGELAVAIRLLLSEPVNIEGLNIHTTASIGISKYPEDGNDVEAMLKKSDTAMYAAKKNGKDGYQYFNNESHSELTDRLMIENDLRYAIDESQLDLHYQPIVDVKTGEVVAVEALVRWNHPVRGMIPPDKFIAIAEESGLILPLGEWVLDTACKQYMSWREDGCYLDRIAVNLSAKQFRQDDLIGHLLATLEKHKMSPENLGLEITETVMMDCPEMAALLFRKLSQLGIELSLDDFGTGYSSLSYLKRFRVDKLKIDRSFVKDIPIDEDDMTLVSAIIAMSHNMGIKVVAEGIETKEQLEFMRAHDCECYQGYFYSKPIPGASIPTAVRNTSSRVDKLVQLHDETNASIQNS